MPNLNFEAELNGPQLDAVNNLEGPVLIIAGAGSGKTRVITYRIAHMLERGIPQSAILALTFTNKAAREMESRVKELTGRKLQNLTVSTFHAFGVKILREEIEALDYRKNFSIYDEADRKELIRDCLRECSVNPEGIDMYAVSALFSNVKTGRVRWGDGADNSYEHVYNEYQSSLKVYNAVDFDDLLVLPIALFESRPEILEKYHKTYRYLMIDEFQDTSVIQYQLMKMLSYGEQAAAPDRKPPNICVVGDDDQSIYSWRGANYGNILMFERDFPLTHEIKLEQNYRSTTTILEAANGIISNNTNRKEKRLWSGNGGGRPIILHTPKDEREEADFISTEIKKLMFQERLNYDDFGVLIRTNSLSRAIEESFLAEKIPYQMSGGTSFFDRPEIRDTLSYLRLIANENDDVNLLRIINTPRRGIGKATISAIGELAKQNHTPLWDAMGRLRYAQNTLFEEAGKIEIDAFMTLIEFYKNEILRFVRPAGGIWRLSAKVRGLVDNIDYWSYLVTEYSKNEKVARWKFLNIESLIHSIEDWENDPDNFDNGLYAYLNRISLLTNGDTGDRQDDGDIFGKGKVNLMTIHAAKGLEFPVVFIAGAEDGIIPHARSLEDGEDGDVSPIEEERRLFYVAITRARDKLFISSCLKRRRMQGIADCLPSPFLAEIPNNLIEYYKEETEEEAAASADAAAEAFFAQAKAKFFI
ncbi:DNA helicase [Spirochaetia bacterium]|nr:DNA helicase [Spirochaetia bacterium]